MININVVNGVFTIFCLIFLSRLLDLGGGFGWLGLHVVRLGFYNRWLLWMLVVVIGGVISGLLSVYGMVLIWFPMVLEILAVLKFEEETMMGFVLGLGLIGDLSSLFFPSTNLVTAIAANEVDVFRYFLVMFPVIMVAIGFGLIVMSFYFGSLFDPPYRVNLPIPKTAIRDRLLFEWGFSLLVMLGGGYVLSGLFGVPVFVVPLLILCFLLLIALRWFRGYSVIKLGEILKIVPIFILLYSVGCYVVFSLLQVLPLIEWLNYVFRYLAEWGVTQAIVGTGLLSGVLGGLVNNFPGMLVNNLAIGDDRGLIGEGMFYANMIGGVVGSRVSPIGSLSNLLIVWVILSKKLSFNWREFFLINLALTLPVLCVSLLGLAIWIPWLFV